VRIVICSACRHWGRCNETARVHGSRRRGGISRLPCAYSTRHSQAKHYDSIVKECGQCRTTGRKRFDMERATDRVGATVAAVAGTRSARHLGAAGVLRGLSAPAACAARRRSSGARAAWSCRERRFDTAAANLSEGAGLRGARLEARPEPWSTPRCRNRHGCTARRACWALSA